MTMIKVFKRLKDFFIRPVTIAKQLIDNVKKARKNGYKGWEKVEVFIWTIETRDSNGEEMDCIDCRCISHAQIQPYVVTKMSRESSKFFDTNADNQRQPYRYCTFTSQKGLGELTFEIDVEDHSNCGDGKIHTTTYKMTV